MYKILIICKDQSSTATISNITKEMNYNTISISDKDLLEETIIEENPDCIITDVNNIKDNNDSFLKLKEQKIVKNTPILLLIKTKDDMETIDNQLNSFADDSIKYPIDKIELKYRLNSMLKLRHCLEKNNKEQEFITRILDSTDSFIAVTDFNFKIVLYNNYVSKFFYSSKNILNQNLLDLAFPESEYRKNIKETFQMFIESDSNTFHPEIILTKSNKIEYPHKWTITKELFPITNEKVLIFVGHDLTETRRYESMVESLLADSKIKNMQLEEANEMLEIKNKELSELNSLKTEYISIVSHDLRSPISQIMGLSQILLKSKKYNTTEKQKNIINKILESAEFQLSLISDILDITRVETGHMKLELELNDINSIIEKSVENIKDLAKNKGIDINIHGVDEMRLIKFDKLKITQVLNNLLGNAVKFTKENGRIDIFVEIEDNTLSVIVKDTGVGIPKEELQNIFEKFGKHRKKGTMGEKGTGLGLSICKKLIELHKGTISVESEYGKGSAFSFSIPTRQ